MENSTNSLPVTGNEAIAKAIAGLQLRSIGPAFMGGRIADIAVHPSQPTTWYIAVGSGGLWKTVNAGVTWQPVFEKQPSYSLGCVTLDPSNPEVVWVGTGEAVSGRHVAWGDGVYRSRDGGRTWQQMELSHRGHITYLDQHGPYGNGTPVLNAARSFGDEPVLVLWPDDVFVAEVPRAQQLIRAYEQTSAPVLALMPMPPEQSRRYGVPVVKEDLDDGLLRITGLVEKPEPDNAPSAFAAIGGYVVTPGVIDELREQTKRWYEHRTGEVYLTDAINEYAKHRAVYGQVIRGSWYDTGNPADYLIAQFASALAHPGYGGMLRELVERSKP